MSENLTEYVCNTECEKCDFPFLSAACLKTITPTSDRDYITPEALMRNKVEILFPPGGDEELIYFQELRKRTFLDGIMSNIASTYYDNTIKEKMISQIDFIIDCLDEQDAEGHIWWKKFKDYITNTIIK